MADKLIFSDEDLIQLSKYTDSNSVSKLLNKFGGDIDRLKSYVKWIYKYGGTGGGGWGNGPGGISTGWSVNAYINGRIIDKTTIIENEMNTVKVSISRPGSDSYTIKLYLIEGSNSKLQGDIVTINAEHNLYNVDVKITKSCQLLLEVTNNATDEIKSIQTQCVIGVNDLSLSLLNNSNNAYQISDNILSLNTIKSNNGFKLRINHRIYVDGKNITLNINIVHPNGSKLIDINLGDYGKNIESESEQYYTDIDLYNLFNFNSLTNDDLAGAYYFDVNLIYSYNGPQRVPKKLNITLIPANELYLIIRPTIAGSIIYKNQQDITDSNLYVYQHKKINFEIIPYKPGGGRVELTIQKNGGTPIPYVLNSNTSTVQSITCDNNSENIQENILKFTLYADSAMTSYKTLTYYVYLDKQTSALNWFDSVDVQRDYRFIDTNNDIEYSDEYINIQSDVINGLRTNKEGPISFNNIDRISNFNSADNSILIYSENNTTYTTGQDLLISIGLQYSEINDSTNKIFELNFNNISNRKIEIYQNKIIIGGDSNQNFEIFIPIEENYDISKPENYHLLNILINKVKNISNPDRYELIFYIDGFIENAYNKVFITNSGYSESSGIRLDHIKCFEGNYGINLINVSYLSNIENIENHTTQLNDNDILQYFYHYQESIGIDVNDKITDFINFKSIYDNFIERDFIDNNGYVKTTVYQLDAKNLEDFKSQLQISSTSNKYNYNVPILLLSFNLQSSNVTDKEIEDFFDFFSKKYGEGEESAKLPDVTYPTFITWWDENGTIYNANSQYEFKLQGSSTGKYKSKNFNLTATSTSGGDEEYVTLFSPNFKANISNEQTSDDYLTFLPENTFTFKADAVDSTHSNNTSIGLFVNKNTTQFYDAKQNQGSGKYTKYIKNCLLGFPVLVFFGFTKSNQESEYFYMGIYNFNLGRQSYLNLGYYNLSEIFSNLYSYDGKHITLNEFFSGEYDGFHEFKVPQSKYQPINDNQSNQTDEKEAITIAEIQGGNSFYDFSQFDESILFGFDDQEMMFGDFYSSKGNYIRDFEKLKIQDFVNGVSIIGGHLFEKLQKNMSNSIDNNYGYELGYSDCVKVGNKYYITQSTNSVPNYKHQVKLIRNTSSTGDKYIQSWSTINPNNYYESQNDFIRFFTRFIGVESNTEGSSATFDIYYNHNDNDRKFVNLLDYTSLVEYYTLCMAFGLVDSVRKNLNIKSFKRTGKFYIAFYDMDTSLSRNNNGRYVSPFSFSDYWTSYTDSAKDKTYNTIFRDFYPNKELSSLDPYTGNILDLDKLNDLARGYDIPSSYLFAIAKYAQVFYNAESLNITANYNTYPNYYWFKLRKSDNSPLANPDAFINNYFSKNTNNINKSLFNLNYRYKYLQKINESTEGIFNTTNLDSFHGRGLYSLKYWLSKRFHILDAYFNITNSPRPFEKYNITTNIWDKINIGSESDPEFIYEPTYEKILNRGNLTEDDTLFNNTNIEIDDSIIKSSSQYQGSVGRKAKIKALPYSPMNFIYQQSSENFICIDPLTEYAFSGGEESGALSITYGGSTNWTWVSNFAPLISSDASDLSISGKYLQNFYVSGGIIPSLTFTNMYSLKDISIVESPNTTCSLNLSNDSSISTNTNLNSLKTINISGSGCSLNLNSLNVTNINLDGTTNENAEFEILNCNYIQDISLINTKATKLEVNPCPNKNLNLQNCDIKLISLTNRNYKNLSINITDNSTVETIELTGYSDITIINCKKLNNIIINEVREKDELGNNKEYNEETDLIIKSLKIENCGDSSIKFTINGKQQTDTTLDISSLEQLEEISFNSIVGFETIILPNNNIKLLYQAFCGTDLTYINFADKTNANHKLILGYKNTKTETFKNSRFTLSSNYEDEDDCLYFEIYKESSNSGRTVSLADIFKIDTRDAHKGIKQISNIVISDCYNFLHNLVNKDLVSSLNSAFYGQTKMSLGKEQYKSQTFLGGFSRLSDIQYMFEKTNVYCINKLFFGSESTGYCASNIVSINIMNFVPYDKFQYFEYGALNGICQKMTGFLFNDVYSDSSDSQNVTNKGSFEVYGNLPNSQELDVNQFLFNINSETQNSNTINFRITTLSGFSIKTSNSSNALLYKLNFNNLFKYGNFSNLKYIYNICENLIRWGSNPNFIINDFSIARLNNLQIFDESFTNSTSVDNNNIANYYQYASSTSITQQAIDNFMYTSIDIYKFWNWNLDNSNPPQIMNIGVLEKHYKPDENGTGGTIGREYMYKFYKIINLSDTTNRNKWKQIWDKINSWWIDIRTKRAGGLSHLFRQSLFIFDNDENYKYLKFGDYENNTILSNINQFQGLCAYSTGFVKTAEDNYIHTGIILDNNTFINTPGLQTLNYLFTNSIFDGSEKYPFPNELFKPLRTNLTSLHCTFQSLRINPKNNSWTGEIHCTYNNGNNSKPVYYTDESLGSNDYTTASIYSTFRNYRLSSIEYQSIGDGKVIGYPCLPEDLFVYNTNLTTLEYTFSCYGNCQGIEGYLPANLLQNQQNLTQVSNFIANARILPQYIKTINKNDTNKPKIYIDDNALDINLYTFVPSNFLSNQHLGYNSNIFNFAMLLSDNYKKDRLYLMTNKSLGNNKIGNIKLVTTGNYGVYKSASAAYQIVVEGIYNSSYLIKRAVFNNTGGLNLCINLSNSDNPESEGIDKSVLNNNFILLDENLSNVYCGYIFKPNTILYKSDLAKYDGQESANVAISGLKKYTIGNNTFLSSLSKTMILPAILYISKYNNEMNPGDQFYTDMLKDKFFNMNIKSYYQFNKFISFNSDNYMVSGSLLPYSSIDKNNIDINGITNEILQNYIQSDQTNINNITNLKYWVYSNYNLLYNNWIGLFDSSNKLIKMTPYGNFYIKDPNNENKTVLIKDYTQSTNTEIKLKYGITLRSNSETGEEYISSCNPE